MKDSMPESGHDSMSTNTQTPTFTVGEVWHPWGATAWTVIATGDMIALQSQGGQRRSVTPDRLWNLVQRELRRPRTSQDCDSALTFHNDGSVVSPILGVISGPDDHTTVVVEWARPVMRDVEFDQPSSVAARIFCDTEGASWIQVLASSPEADGSAELTRSSALQLAGELTRLAARM